ncbi:MAG: LptF/LptG family permease [Candidatus Ornithospirochaeta sp.]|nr:LptF/LptG family permease [Candidatus Ornithospirochaeta sp.]
MRKSYSRLSRYISREFMRNFIVSFIFFFCIFFINSILLLVQKILLKNIDLATMIQMVALSMPQFMVYIFPFATLSASSMLLGDLSSANEILAIRSSGISSYRIFRPIILLSIAMSLLTFFFADAVLPWSSVIYKDKLAYLMQEMPTFEIDSNSINKVGGVVLSNGESRGNTIRDIVMVNSADGKKSTLASSSGTLDLIDPVNYIYSLSLEDPELLISQKEDDSFVKADAERGIYYLDFSSQIPSLTSTSPVNLSSRDLIESIRERNSVQEKDRESWRSDREGYLLSISELTKKIEREGNPIQNRERMDYLKSRYESAGDMPTSFYGQYYKAELMKKFVLSAACMVMAFVTLPLSLFRIKHGKLTGFAISLLIAVAFWYMLFAAQLGIFEISSSPYLLIALPDIVIFLLSAILLWKFRKAL